jgi:hypothetical protein
MKRLPYLFASASLLIATPAMSETPTADLLVNGSITPGPACDVALGNGALDLGRISRASLNEDASQPTKLDEQSIRTMVTCPSPRRFAFVVTEAGGSDAAEEYVFKMHDTGKDATAGELFLLFDTQSTKIDGAQGYATGSQQGTSDLEHATWGPATPSREDLPITNGRYAVGFVKTAESEDAPVYMKALSVDLIVRPFINPVNELDLSGDIAFASDIGLEIRYF